MVKWFFDKGGKTNGVKDKFFSAVGKLGIYMQNNEAELYLHDTQRLTRNR